ncbi:MAG TPA: glycosyltransferase family 1 protein [Candidatus Competibacteraceae bacterium]|nr:glycosyltransferase family 1 protein [Candidatus Competibacteraceae bacterium]
MADLLTRLHDSWRTRIQKMNWTPWKTAAIPKQTVLFYRDFRGFTGGHLKVWHYFNHVQHSPSYTPHIAFSAESVWNDNPWYPIRHEALAVWDAERADILFLAGMDWGILSEAQRHAPPKPVINLIQHVRHADPNEPLYQFLSHRAVRICVSEPVTQALHATRKVNGPLFTIPNGMDFTELSPPFKPWETRDLDILIVGIKQPALATELHGHLKTSNQRVEALIDPIPRKAFLELLGNAKIALFLPHVTEGFYLPALEGFALETLVICPDCIGNRTFCVPDENCLQPPYLVESLLHTVQQALHMPPLKRLALLDAAQRMAQQHSLLKERRSFLEILQQIENIW